MNAETTSLVCYSEHVNLWLAVEHARAQVVKALAGDVVAVAFLSSYADSDAISGRPSVQLTAAGVAVALAEARAARVELVELLTVAPVELPTFAAELLAFDCLLEALAVDAWNRDMEDAYIEDIVSWSAEHPDEAYPVILAGRSGRLFSCQSDSVHQSPSPSPSGFVATFADLPLVVAIPHLTKFIP